jgi:hypothetical protein
MTIYAQLGKPKFKPEIVSLPAQCGRTPILGRNTRPPHRSDGSKGRVCRALGQGGAGLIDELVCLKAGHVWWIHHGYAGSQKRLREGNGEGQRDLNWAVSSLTDGAIGPTTQ